ncbi:DUF2388 domain-containing protein [Pseudomonas sichuanensis]|uniref:DUF2388 domain-containing protein n=1 Tax=Pseudomonas TaxID=286 RepID=UPI00129A7A68|nr:MULTISPECIES: DUF2388 domain-containing protein [Pseudomonas]MDH0733675.1 DUF2388 domain-containing protein [Pseudomonas sichuanensis]MDH1585428.1 DUF2388 domain-containing protein [Pseudomonas sichuanensis]MDH1595282.1 DUF2388 domain-containing protein [Pseudomonas sichuanensis]MDH1600440.1 DUF2388 domain-containing protein [Pseudomonas sichuanensis]MDU9400882.1 DUF2388 domain-containing protein [Pseudomonas sp. zfem004]
MSRYHLFAAAALLSLAGAANATSFVVTTDAVVGAVAATTDATSDVTSSFRDDKIVQAARDDAASFVGSEGAIRGAKLESALVHIRQQQPTLQASDAQLARAILAL